MAKLVYSGLLLVDLFSRPLKKLVDSAHCRCTGHWNDKHLTVPPTQRGKKNLLKRTKWGKRIVQNDWRSKGRGPYREISESRKKEERRQEEKKIRKQQGDLWSTGKWCFPFNTLHLLLINWIAPGIHQRGAGRWRGEGCTAETGHGRVPPNWRNIRELQAQTQEKHHRSSFAAHVHSWLHVAFSREGSHSRKAFPSAIPLLSRQIFAQTTTNPSGGRNTAALMQT